MNRPATLLLALWLPALPAVPAIAQTQADMNREAGEAYKKADAALNRTYDALSAKVSPEGKDALRDAQRTWIEFRDKECAFETLGSRGGSIHPMVLTGCAAQLTEARTKQLRAQLDCQEGDASCGGQ